MEEEKLNKQPIKSAVNRGADGRFLPGNNANPNGRPRNPLCITARQREMLPEPCPYATGKTWLEWLAERGMALAGENPTYYRELLNRIEGETTGKMDIETKQTLLNVTVKDEQSKQLLDRLVKGE